MKCSPNTLLKYAEAAASVTEQDAPSDLKKYLAIATLSGAPFWSMGTRFIFNKINDAVDPSSDVGQKFHEFAVKRLNDAPGHSRYVYLAESEPRAYGPLIDAGILPKYYELTAAVPAKAMFSLRGTHKPNMPGKTISKAIIDDLRRGAGPMYDAITAAMSEHPSPGKQELLNLLLNGKASTEKATQMGQKLLSAPERAVVMAPRNNLYSLAHEHGHLSDLNLLDDIGARLEKIVPGAHGVFNNVVAAISEPMDSTFSAHFKPYLKAKAALANANPLLSAFIEPYLQTPIAGMASSALAGSQTIRDILRTILPFDATDKAMSIIEEHPVATAVSGFVPQVLREMSTSIPGTRLIHDFYKSIPGSSPKLEALKFLGHNLMSNSSYLLAPATAAAIAYLNSNRRSEK